MATVPFVIVSPGGEIVSTGSCSEEQLVHLAPTPDHMVFQMEASNETHYFDGTAVVPYTPAQLEARALEGIFGVWSNSAMSWVDERPLEVVRDQKWEEIKARREQVIYGGFTWDGSVFDSTTNAQLVIPAAALEAFVASAMGEPYTRAWTLADNTVRVLSGADCIAMAKAMGAHIDAAHQTGRALRSFIYAPETTREQIAALAWP